MGTDSDRTSGEFIDPRLRRLVQSYRTFMEGGRVEFPSRIAGMYGRSRLLARDLDEATRGPLLDRPNED